MRLKEVIVETQLNEFGDQIRTSMYRNLGIGGDAANEIAAKKNFVDRFTQQVKQNQKAASKSGLPLNMDKLIKSYLGQYGWSADAEQQTQLKQLADAVSKETGMMGGSAFYSPELTKLANAMYMIGSQQIRDPRTGQSLGGGAGLQGGGPGGASAGDSAGATDDGKPEPELSVTTQQIIAKIQKLVGKDNLDDLTSIAKYAMQVLYKQSPQTYTDLYKEIMTGETKKKALSPQEVAARKRQILQKRAARQANSTSTPAPATPTEPEDNPNIIRGTNESRRFYRR